MAAAQRIDPLNSRISERPRQGRRDSGLPDARSFQACPGATAVCPGGPCSSEPPCPIFILQCNKHGSAAIFHFQLSDLSSLFYTLSTAVLTPQNTARGAHFLRTSSVHFFSPPYSCSLPLVIRPACTNKHLATQGGSNSTTYNAWKPKPVCDLKSSTRTRFSNPPARPAT